VESEIFRIIADMLTREKKDFNSEKYFGTKKSIEKKKFEGL